jgi:hypothetical protein
MSNTPLLFKKEHVYSPPTTSPPLCLCAGV